MNQADVKAICLFFFLGMLDEYRSVEAASQALALFQKRIHESPQENRAIIFVSVTKQVWLKARGHIYRGKPNFSNNSGWIFPLGLDFGPWKEFQKLAQEDELLAVIWSKVLSISDEDIAKGEGISVGTLKYRLGKGLRKLGSFSGESRILGVVKQNER